MPIRVSEQTLAFDKSTPTRLDTLSLYPLMTIISQRTPETKPFPVLRLLRIFADSQFREDLGKGVRGFVRVDFLFSIFVFMVLVWHKSVTGLHTRITCQRHGNVLSYTV